eukprot:8377588-Ditylum_brightwellii.AAC.1
MVHTHKQTLDNVDDNNIGCLTPHDNSTRAEGTMLFHGVDSSVDGGERHLTHLTQEVDCCVKERKKQNVHGRKSTKSRNVLCDSAISSKGKEFDNHVDGCVDNCFDGCFDSHVDCCVDVAKEDGVDGSIEGGENHLTHLTQEVDCCVKERKKQNMCGLNLTKIRNVLYDSAISNEGKEVNETMLFYDVDGSVDGGDNHLTMMVLMAVKTLHV